MKYGAIPAREVPRAGTCRQWDDFRAAVDGLAWDGARFYAADAAVLHRTSIPRLCELTLTAAVREHNNLALEVWRAANPDKPPA